MGYDQMQNLQIKRQIVLTEQISKKYNFKRNVVFLDLILSLLLFLCWNIKDVSAGFENINWILWNIDRICPGGGVLRGCVLKTNIPEYLFNVDV